MTSAVEKYFEPSEPVVVLVTKESDVLEVIEECKMFTGKRKVTAYCARENSFSDDDVENLQDFLRNPEGILITDSECFLGMQARNIIVVGDESKFVRNYVMRAISQIIFIQDEGLIDSLTINKKSSILGDNRLIAFSSIEEQKDLDKVN